MGRVITSSPGLGLFKPPGVWVQQGFWVATVDNAGGYVVPYSMKALPGGAGAIVAAGVFVGGVQRAAVFRLNPSGTVAWCRVLSQGASTGAIYRVSLGPGGVIGFAGRQDDPGTGRQNALIGQLSSAGAVQWFSTWDGAVAGLLPPFGLTHDSAGNLYACASDAGLSTAVWKFNSAGAVQWQQTVNWGTNTGLVSLALDAAETVIYTGGAYAGELVGLSTATGAVAWPGRYLASVALNGARFFSLAVSGGLLYALGESTGGGALGQGLLAAAINPSTNAVVWDQFIQYGTIGAGSGLGGWDVAIRSGQLYGVGNTNTATVLAVPVSFNAATGALNWMRTLSGSSSYQLSPAAVDSLGLWLGWSDATSGSLALLNSSGAWASSLEGGATAVATPAYTVSTPGSTIAAPAWTSAAGIFTPTALPLASSTATLSSTVFATT